MPTLTSGTGTGQKGLRGPGVLRKEGHDDDADSEAPDDHADNEARDDHADSEGHTWPLPVVTAGTSLSLSGTWGQTGTLTAAVSQEARGSVLSPAEPEGRREAASPRGEQTCPGELDLGRDQRPRLPPPCNQRSREEAPWEGAVLSPPAG